MKDQLTLGVIIGNRGFFPNHLCESGRVEILDAIAKAGHKAVVLDSGFSVGGSIESLDEARACAKLFEDHRADIAGVVVALPNFGDERAIANALRWAALDVPVLVQAFPDDPKRMTIKDRRDSFCGKMSACANLRQYGIKYSLTTLHCDHPSTDSFEADLARFAATCRILRKLRNLRVGALGARPAAFNTVRYSEKLLEAAGISVETLDLYDLFGRVGRLKDDDAAVQAKLQAIRDYVDAKKVPQEYLMKMARFGAAVDAWMRECQLEATAIQCWTAMEEFFGVVPCTCMSMMSNDLVSSACEVDIMGTVAMVALAAASGKPSAIVDWNNNYGGDPDKGVIFHCSNLPKDVFKSAKGAEPTMEYQEIIAGSVGAENTYGTIYGRVKAEPFTYLRASTDDAAGRIRAYTGRGELTDDPMETFGGFGVFRIPGLQKLLRHICRQGFEHHVAINLSDTADAVEDALGNYLGWDLHRHEG